MAAVRTCELGATFILVRIGSNTTAIRCNENWQHSCHPV